MSLFIAAQIVSVLAYSITFLVAFQKSRKRFLILNMSASAVFGIHYLMLGAFSGAASNFLGVARAATFTQKNKNKLLSTWFLPIVFILLYIAIAIFTWQAWYGILPSIGMIVYTVGIWFEKVKYMKISSIFSSVCWIIYNAFVKSYVGLIIETLVFCMFLFSLIKYDILKQTKKDKDIKAE